MPRAHHSNLLRRKRMPQYFDLPPGCQESRNSVIISTIVQCEGISWSHILLNKSLFSSYCENAGDWDSKTSLRVLDNSKCRSAKRIWSFY